MVVIDNLETHLQLSLFRMLRNKAVLTALANLDMDGQTMAISEEMIQRIGSHVMMIEDMILVMADAIDVIPEEVQQSKTKTGRGYRNADKTLEAMIVQMSKVKANLMTLTKNPLLDYPITNLLFHKRMTQLAKKRRLEQANQYLRRESSAKREDPLALTSSTHPPHHSDGDTTCCPSGGNSTARGGFMFVDLSHEPMDTLEQGFDVCGRFDYQNTEPMEFEDTVDC